MIVIDIKKKKKNDCDNFLGHFSQPYIHVSLLNKITNFFEKEILTQTYVLLLTKWLVLIAWPKSQDHINCPVYMDTVLAGNPQQPGNPVHHMTQPIPMVTACSTHFNPNNKEQSWTAITILFGFRVSQEQTHTCTQLWTIPPEGKHTISGTHIRIIRFNFGLYISCLSLHTARNLHP